jgi:hypothetical protein
MARNAAIDAYLLEITEADELVKEIALFIDDHGEVAPDDVNWSHVGNMAQVVYDLKATLKFIRSGQQ